MSAQNRYDNLFRTISELVFIPSPSGVDEQINRYLSDFAASLGVEFETDQAGNFVIFIPGTGAGNVLITAHKDEIGAIVQDVDSDGRLRVKRLGRTYPWIYGEGVVDLLGEHETVSGVLCFGSRHVSQRSAQFAFREKRPIQWDDAWVETMKSADELERAGIRVGTRMVIGEHRKKPFRMSDYVASYALDNKASLAVLMEIAKRIRNPPHNIYLAATANEEPGGLGALFLSHRVAFDLALALEIAPVAPEYNVLHNDAPVLLVEDSFALYDHGLNNRLLRLGRSVGINLQTAIYSGFGSDASICVSKGHVPRAACLGFPTQNTHGFEIAHMGAIENLLNVATEFCGSRVLT